MSTMADKTETTDTTAPTTTVPPVAAEEPKPETPVVEPASTQAETAEPAAPAEQTTPVTDGVLGYKAPGLIKSLRFTKKHFWFGDEAVPAKDLQSYLRDEKPDVAHHNVAWSSHTGKGLLYMAKTADQKATPTGIINLSDISELTKDGVYEFHFKLHGHKHSFQAASMPERDAWFARIETVSAEAKGQVDEVKNSAGYKENLEQLGKLATTATAPAVAPRKSSDKTPTGVKADSSSSDSSRAEDKKDKKSKEHRSRSASRKRTSLFGSLLGRKEEHEEKKSEAEATKADAAVKPLETEPATTGEPSTKAEESKPTNGSLDAQAIASRVVAAPVIPVDESKPAPVAKDGEAVAPEAPKTTEPVSAEPVTPVTPKETPKPSKRNSFFNSFFQRRDVASPSDEKKEHDAAPAVPAKDSEIPATAPTLPEPATVTGDKPSEPIASPVSPATNEASKDKPSSVPKEGFFGRFLRQDKPKAHEPKDAKTEEEQKAESQATAAPESTVAGSTDAPGAVSSTSAKAEEPVAETPSPGSGAAKDKRRPSFFNTLGSRKEKKAEVAPENEHAESEGKKSGFGGLFRKPSRGAKALFDQNKKETAPATSEPTSTDAPAVPAEGTTAAEEAPKTETTPTAPITSTVDDIAPVATGQPAAKPAPAVQAAA